MVCAMPKQRGVHKRPLGYIGSSRRQHNRLSHDAGGLYPFRPHMGGAYKAMTATPHADWYMFRNDRFVNDEATYAKSDANVDPESRFTPLTTREKYNPNTLMKPAPKLPPKHDEIYSELRQCRDVRQSAKRRDDIQFFKEINASDSSCMTDVTTKSYGVDLLESRRQDQVQAPRQSSSSK